MARGGKPGSCSLDCKPTKSQKTLVLLFKPWLAAKKTARAIFILACPSCRDFGVWGVLSVPIDPSSSCEGSQSPWDQGSMHLRPATCTWVLGCCCCCAASLLCTRPMPCGTIRLHVFCSSIAAQLWGPCSTAAGATQRPDTFIFFVEMRSGIPIWLGVMGAAGSPSHAHTHTHSLSISFRPSPEGSGSRLGRWGKGGGGEKA